MGSYREISAMGATGRSAAPDPPIAEQHGVILIGLIIVHVSWQDRIRSASGGRTALWPAEPTRPTLDIRCTPVR
jgi:hypothetical protein